MITDLTKEHPDKILWRFLLPLMISVIFQQFYNIADSMIAGKFAGESALGAVGASYPITIIYMAFAVGMEPEIRQGSGVRYRLHLFPCLC